MGRGAFAAIILGVVGCAILVSLGSWQLQRLARKEGILAEIDARIAAAPGSLPNNPTPDTHRYLPVQLSGTFAQDHLRVLVSVKRQGAGYRIIRPFEHSDDGRRILVDQGFVPTEAELAPPDPATQLELVGNLHWPEEVDGYTPEPDLGRNIWFARDVPRMAEALGTEPTLLVLRSAAPAQSAEGQPKSAKSLPGQITPSPMPVSRAGIPNDHLQYAITWFSLAGIWLGMTLYWLWRMRQRIT